MANTSPAKKPGGLDSPITFGLNGVTYNRPRTTSNSSDSSSSSQLTAKRSPHAHRSPQPASGASASTPNVAQAGRAPPRPHNDLPLRAYSPVVDIGAAIGGHRRQHSQGFFEPSLPSTSGTNSPTTNQNMPNLTASQIAAQAAMHVQNPAHNRKRSQTIPEQGTAAQMSSMRPPPLPASAGTLSANTSYQNGSVGGTRSAATAAANVAFPRSPLHSPGIPDYAPSTAPDQKPAKERSKMKLFSKPKSIGITKDKDADKKYPPMPSPNKFAMQSTGNLAKLYNASTTSLIDPAASSASSIYSSANASTSTLVPTTTLPDAKEKEKHKHHFLRSKNKVKDKDGHDLALSSASSTSKPTDPSAPQPLYSFAAPSSPGHAGTFSSGLDLRHGGRALRQKKKEEKAASLTVDGLDQSFRDRNPSVITSSSEWPGPGSLAATATTPVSHTPDASLAQVGYGSLGTTFGLPGMTQDDAWPLLKARLLHIFEGEDPRPPVEDFNQLVSVHIRRCIQKRAPTILIEDLTEMLQTGFGSLDQTLRNIPDDRLVIALVEMWMIVFTTILPFLQAVFLPLDLEFKGRGQFLSGREAAEFWGAALPDSTASREIDNIPTLGEELDVRRITLLTFRDTVILPRNDVLMAIFSRLSLENLGTGITADGPLPEPVLPFATGSSGRPGTAQSADANISSFNSQSSTLLESVASQSTSNLSAGARSRATSNTSAGSFHSIHTPPPPPPMDSARVTETVGRMLQCVSVLASVQSGDESQTKMERLTKELKYNWLGRGRTGRQRRGFVGPRVPRGQGVVA